MKNLHRESVEAKQYLDQVLRDQKVLKEFLK